MDRASLERGLEHDVADEHQIPGSGRADGHPDGGGQVVDDVEAEGDGGDKKEAGRDDAKCCGEGMAEALGRGAGDDDDAVGARREEHQRVEPDHQDHQSPIHVCTSALMTSCGASLSRGMRLGIPRWGVKK
ncbi:MAG: hypothetical protein AAGG79_06305 [Pseudomonadota bacterium]